MSPNIGPQTSRRTARAHTVSAIIESDGLVKQIRKTSSAIVPKSEQGIITQLEPLCYKPTQYDYEGDHIQCRGAIPAGTAQLNEIVIILHIAEWRYALCTGEVIE